MPRDLIVSGIDIGSTNIRTVVAQIKAGDPRPQILGVGISFAKGMRKGIVIDPQEATDSIRQAVDMAEQTSGLSVKSAYVSISGSHVASRKSSGVIAVSRADGQISDEDVRRVIKAAQAVSIPKNKEILHTITRNFVIDNQEAVKDPVGMSGVRLEVDALIVEAASPFIKNLHKCVNEAGLEINQVVLSSLAASQAVLSKRQKELGVLVLDIGGGTTDYIVFEESDVIHAGVLPLGSGYITNDIAIGLRTDIDTAERVKIEYGSVLPEEVKKNETIDLSLINPCESFVADRHEVSKFIEARTVEILDLINKELKKANRQLLPAGVVLLGGGVKLYGFVDLVKNKLSLPAQLGFPSNLGGLVDKVNDPSFVTAVGLVLWGMENEAKDLSGFRMSIPSVFNTGSMNGSINRIKKIFKDFIP